jgi:hypothetical protein
MERKKDGGRQTSKRVRSSRKSDDEGSIDRKDESKHDDENEDGGYGEGDDSDSSSDDGREKKEARKEDDNSNMDRLARLRKEKRLAMNRESARVRRRRKKILIQSLEGQVAELTSKAQELQSTNARLLTRLQVVESELSMANSTITQLLALQQKLEEGVSRTIPLSGQGSNFGRQSSISGLLSSTNARFDDELNILLRAQASRQPPNPDAVTRSLLYSDTSLGRALAAGSDLGVGRIAQQTPFGREPSLAAAVAAAAGSSNVAELTFGDVRSRLQSRGLNLTGNTNAVAGIHTESFDNAVRSHCCFL